MSKHSINISKEKIPMGTRTMIIMMMIVWFIWWDKEKEKPGERGLDICTNPNNGMDTYLACLS